VSVALPFSVIIDVPADSSPHLMPSYRILYDLKTATRVFVLEGHKHKITACSFSPDGRRV
jgi:WD40 repeat protein